MKKLIHIFLEILIMTGENITIVPTLAKKVFTSVAPIKKYVIAKAIDAKL